MPRASQAGKGRLRSISPHPREESCVRPLKKKKKKKRKPTDNQTERLENRLRQRLNARRQPAVRLFSINPIWSFDSFLVSDFSSLLSYTLSPSLLPVIEGDSFLNFQLCTRDERYKQGRAGLLFHVQGIRARDLIQRGGRFAESRRGNDLHSAARTTSSFKPFRPMAAGSVFLDAGVGCCLPTAILFFQALRRKEISAGAEERKRMERIPRGPRGRRGEEAP